MLAFILYTLSIAIVFYIWSIYDTAKMVKSIEPDTQLSRTADFIYNTGRMFKK